MNAIYGFKHLETFTYFVIERHNIWRRREAGNRAPWTNDEILKAYRFCNVYRELDRTTKWITDHWRTPNESNPHLWFAMVVSRLVNHPETLAQMGFPLPWNKKSFLRTMLGRKKEGAKVFGSAYIVSTNGVERDKANYLADDVLDPMWKDREKVKPIQGDRLQDFFARLMSFQGMGLFMSAQVVADIKYVSPLMGASDWWTFASSGPGSRRGMSYLLGYDPRTPWKEHEWKEALMELSVIVKPIFQEARLPRLHNQDLQNCLCEFSKYRRTQLGTGRPKQKFTPYELEK